MRGFWIAVAYLLVLAVLAHPLGQALPRRWFDGGRFPYRCYKWEKQGKLYTRIGIERWKKLVPDMSRFLPDMVKKRWTPPPSPRPRWSCWYRKPAWPRRYTPPPSYWASAPCGSGPAGAAWSSG